MIEPLPSAGGRERGGIETFPCHRPRVAATDVSRGPPVDGWFNRQLVSYASRGLLPRDVPACGRMGGDTVSDRPSVLYVTVGEIGERIEAAVDRLDVRRIEATDGVDAIKRLEVEAVDAVVVPATLPDVRVETVVGRIADQPSTGPCIVVGEVGPSPGPLIQVSADVTVDDLADRVRRAIQDRRIGDELGRHERLKTAILRVLGSVDGPAAEPLLHAVYDGLRPLEGYRFVWVGRYDPSEDVVSLVEPVRRQVRVDHIGEELVEVDPASVRRAIDDGTVTQAWEPDAEGVYHADDGLVLTTVPFTDGDRTTGVLLLSTGPDDAPDGSERELLSWLGRFVGVVLGRDASGKGPKPDKLRGLLQIVAHELRDPLQAASIAIDAAREGDQSALDRAAEAIDSMADVIDATVTLARSEGVSGVEPVDVHELAAAVWRDERAGSAELTIASPVTVRADPTLLERLLSNLLRNAVDHAGTDVSVRVGSLPDGRGFFVEDDGPGIPPERREAVFEWGESSTGEGSGIGLGYAREIAEAHGWAVSVTESRDGGARFEVHTEDRRRRPRDELEALFSGEGGEFVFPADRAG